MTVLAVVLGFIISFSACWTLTRPGPARLIVDHPNHRSLHERAIPRTGGLAIICGLGASTAILTVHADLPWRGEVGWLGAGAVVVAAVSLLDDVFDIDARIRAAAHFLAAIALILGGLRIDRLELPGIVIPLPYWLAVGSTLLFVVWTINLFNFMDGMDGFAGSMSIVGFGTLGLLAANEPLLRVGAFCSAAASLGFLTFNHPPARIFLGDVGSVTLGYLVASGTIAISAHEPLPLWIPAVVFGPFFVDATATLVRRIVRGEEFWEAHRSHYYQRLVRAGWGHRRTLRYGWVLMLLGSFVALIASALSPMLQGILLLCLAAFYLLLLRSIDRAVGFP